jgi:esterase/lipase superfamily enzyme
LPGQQFAQQSHRYRGSPTGLSWRRLTRAGDCVGSLLMIQASVLPSVNGKAFSMHDAFKTARFVVGTLVATAVGFGFRYSQNWLFDPEEAVDSDVVYFDRWARLSTSVSPMRIGQSADSANWKVAVVTNRSFGPPQTLSSMAQVSLQSQVTGMISYIPETTQGFCDVKVPTARNRGLFTTDSQNPACVAPGQFEPADRDAFFQNLNTTIQQGEAKDVLVFVHGFNVSFEDSIARCAQLAEDMPFHGTVVAYSWASAASKSAYETDAMVAERNFWNLAEFLGQLRNRVPKDTRIHLLAHSMGNRVTLRALNALVGTIGPQGEELTLSRDRWMQTFPEWSSWQPNATATPQLSSLILAAPDVEVTEFQRFTTAIRHITHSMVLYASDSDVALESSYHVNQQGYRAGDSRASVDVEGMRVIHVSGVNRLDPLGHSYYGSNPGVLDQIARLIRPQLPINDATPLSEVAAAFSDTAIR